MRLVVELAYETAMRRSEILKLTKDCLHLHDRIADVIDGKKRYKFCSPTSGLIWIFAPIMTEVISLFQRSARV